MSLRWVVGMVLFGAMGINVRAAEPAGGGGSAAMPEVLFELVAKVEDRPLLVTHDGRGRLFIVEQAGRVRMMVAGKLIEKPFLDISEKIYSQGEGGLLGLAFHPKFSQNGLFYVNYTIENKGAERPQVKQGNKVVTQTPIKTVIAEYKVSPADDSVDLASERSVLEIPQPYENHDGGMIAFGPDGMLYIGMGDGGNQRDPHKNGQNLGVLLAKMLRIDVTPRQGYAVPQDNPFVGVAGARPEIWSYGMRNPWRFSFDRQTGLLYAADVGEDRWEEVDIVTRGGNYGWSVREGDYPFNRFPRAKEEKKPASPSEPAEGFAGPIKAYWHDIGMSITGGYVYRGKALPELRGWYLYGDYSKGTIWGLRYEGGKIIGDQTLKIVNDKEVRPMLPSGFGEDRDGEIYVCSHQDGKVWKIVAAEMR
jgi:glucose/arabinose dehydrogenase